MNRLSPVEIIQEKLEKKIAETLSYETKIAKDAGKSCFGIGFEPNTRCDTCSSNKQCETILNNRCVRGV